jgi:hypothetical protein
MSIRLSTVILAVLFLASVTTYLLVRPPESIAGYTPPTPTPATPRPAPSTPSPRPSRPSIQPSPAPSATSVPPSRNPSRSPSPTATTGDSASTSISSG